MTKKQNCVLPSSPKKCNGLSFEIWQADFTYFCSQVLKEIHIHLNTSGRKIYLTNLVKNGYVQLLTKRKFT